MKFHDGQDITSVHTLKSMYDGDSIEVKFDDGNIYRIKTSVLEIVLSQFTYNATKLRKHTYLVEPTHYLEESNG